MNVKGLSFVRVGLAELRLKAVDERCPSRRRMVTTAAPNSGEGFSGEYVPSARDPSRQIFYRRRMPARTPASGLLIVHGYLWHSAWFWELARDLSQEALAEVHAIDLPSHGLSDNIDGLRAYAKSLEDFLDELEAALARLRSALPADAPIFILGESFGGLLVLLLHLDPRFSELFQGVVLCGPLLHPNKEILPPKIVFTIMGLLRNVFPTAVLPGQDLSGKTWAEAFGDPLMVELSQNDPLVGYGEPMRLAFAVSLFEGIDRLEVALGSMKLRNLLILHNEEDTRSSISNSELIMKEVQVSGSKKLVRISGRGHQVFQDAPERRVENIREVVSFVKEMTTPNARK
uniref:Serine aminopeptidase S33 domain-containing protein n=1 Tax=Rhodosorus marinus TaxID=101924 RepID=A0A6T6K467_9RHOD|mmetsp:Transcript_11590/g.16743  ORF Transcript_11590/g.16743 Transcript_11590/m.16743 type:complete len:345 (+) Transcript_11590:210-1244(+)|eukprot:CAMPEP_0184743894 /NCGR_PEP_ID=MMETSP0315-20130426/6674_1 /TAXON_ID=101924 /ORGANISM="Rhodosorus marinus, Strain UTEX LB 2760" /LENGTH=344 /DNA_ID=CAMNT_0027215335 /DNA_START=90 /DNA_END=1124 /DNA_ORIENTATION=-